MRLEVDFYGFGDGVYQHLAHKSLQYNELKLCFFSAGDFINNMLHLIPDNTYKIHISYSGERKYKRTKIRHLPTLVNYLLYKKGEIEF